MDPCERLFAKADLTVTKENITRDWNKLKRGARRKLRIFDWTDWVSWTNVLVLLIMLGGAEVLRKGTLTEAQFFSETYVYKLTLEVEYDRDLVERWTNSLSQSEQALLKPYVKDGDPIPVRPENSPITAAVKLQEHYALWKQSEGLVSRGRAFLSAIGEQKSDSSLDFTEKIWSSDYWWVGVLYYKFPRPNSDWMLDIDGIWNIMSGKRGYTIIHFIGKLVKDEESKTLCFSFIQTPMGGNPRREYDMQFNPGAQISGDLILAENVQIFRNCQSKGTKPFRVGVMRLNIVN